MSWIYLAFAIAGAILPTLSNIEFISIYGGGFDFIKFLQLANANPAAQSLSRDLLVGASCITTWIIVESRRLNIKYLWIILLSSVLISFAFAAPLFLSLRERRLIELNK